MVVPGRLGNYFGFPPQEGLWVFSFAVPSRVGFQAGNTVRASVGFSIFWSLKQKSINSNYKGQEHNETEFRLRSPSVSSICSVGVFIPPTFITL